MFYMNVPPKGELSGAVSDAENGIILAQDRMRHEVKMPEGYERLMFDPQLYLAGLNAKASSATCARLATYPWFQTPGSIDYESGTLGKLEYKGVMKTIADAKWLAQPPGDNGRE